MLRTTLLSCLVIVSFVHGVAQEGKTEKNLHRLKYNNDLVVDLGVGLWANPMPMDYDQDGDWDLVVSCADVPYNGTYFFENTEGASTWPVFKPGVRIGDGLRNTQVSFVNGKPYVLGPGVAYQSFLKNQYSDPAELNANKEFHPGKVRANQWKYCDYNGDGNLDLVVGIGDWNDYGMEWNASGWENAYNEFGQWTKGPLHGFVFLLTNTGSNKSPKYAEPQKVTAGGEPVDVFGMPSPNFVDFDGDGDLDLLCGEFLDKLTYFQNIGSRENPEYATGKVIRIGNKPLKLDLCMIVPVAVDWDKDGDVDLVVGEEDGRVAFVENTGRFNDGIPVFTAPRFFQQQADELKFGALSTPSSYDWDADGDEDLICGNTAGYIGFIENLGGGDNPRWAAPEYIEAGGEIIRIQAGYNGIVQGPSEAKWGYTVLTVGDWNEDGLPDLVVNSSWGKVLWYQNIGKEGAPELLPAKPVEVNWVGAPQKPEWSWWDPAGLELATQWRTTPQVIDFNQDGLLDLVMLDPEGFLAFYEKTMHKGWPYLLPPKRLFYMKKNSAYDRRHEIIDKSEGYLRLNGDRAGRSGRRKFVMTDWDNDGDFDVLVNTDLNVNFLENTGKEGDHFIFEDRGPVGGRDIGGHSTSPTVVDWNKDGVKELLIGAEDGFFYYLK